MSERNVFVDGTWYGPGYPDNGAPPADKVDGKFLGRKVDEPIADGDFVGMKAVTEREEAAQFGSPAPLETTVERDKPTGEVEPVGIKAVQTEDEARAFRGEPAKTSTAKPAAKTDESQDGSTAKPAARRTSK